ncbi:MAG TPA: AI-2E family transporter [Polyangiaceae bacterium]|nr:AI-2E family transporter [Polyangiaceae bacterium]
MRPLTRHLELHIPTKTILKVLVWAFLVSAVIKLWPELVYLSLSLLLAIALGPLVNRMGQAGLSRSVSVSLIALTLLGAAALLVAFVLPPLFQQGSEVAANFPAFRERVQQHLPENPVVKHLVSQLLLLPTKPEVVRQLNKPLVWGQMALSGVTTTFVVLIIALYLVMDGRRLYAWMLAYVPRRHREKMARTVPEVSEVVFGYVRGQVITSLLFAVFTVSLLSVLGVPAAVPLALLAAICDIIPVVGIVVATAPAVLLALTVSPSAAAIVACSYTAYHLLEAYVIVPRIYGRSMRISTLGVLLALIVGGSLQGIIGAVIVLPLVAAYPIIERIWLKGYLAPEVIADHSALARAAETGRDTAIDAVLNGEEQPLSRRAEGST